MKLDPVYAMLVHPSRRCAAAKQWMNNITIIQYNNINHGGTIYIYIGVLWPSGLGH